MHVCHSARNPPSFVAPNVTRTFPAWLHESGVNWERSERLCQAKVQQTGFHKIMTSIGEWGGKKKREKVGTLAWRTQYYVIKYFSLPKLSHMKTWIVVESEMMDETKSYDVITKIVSKMICIWMITIISGHFRNIVMQINFFLYHVCIWDSCFMEINKYCI